jgi:hypothetical protein
MSRPASPVHGRGAQSGAASTRFGLAEREVDGDWRDFVATLDGDAPRLRTTVTEERPKSILSFNQSPDIGFDRSVNAYRGCEHGCVYCFARPTHAFHDLSPGLDFETRLFAKPDAARLLRATLARPGYVPRPIAMGTNTDPYQPIEARYRITRELLEVCLDARHPVTITTKSDRVLRDLDLLAEMARQQLVAVAISVTTLDARLSGKLELLHEMVGDGRDDWRDQAVRRHARLRARKAANCARAAGGGGRADELPGRASHPCHHRPFHGGDRHPRRRSRRGLGRLDRAAPAARGGAAVPRMARRPLSRARRQGDEHRALHSRRARQRS